MKYIVIILLPKTTIVKAIAFTTIEVVIHRQKIMEAKTIEETKNKLKPKSMTSSKDLGLVNISSLSSTSSSCLKYPFPIMEFILPEPRSTLDPEARKLNEMEKIMKRECITFNNSHNESILRNVHILISKTREYIMRIEFEQMHNTLESFMDCTNSISEFIAYLRSNGINPKIGLHLYYHVIYISEEEQVKKMWVIFKNNSFLHGMAAFASDIVDARIANDKCGLMSNIILSKL